MWRQIWKRVKNREKQIRRVHIVINSFTLPTTSFKFAVCDDDDDDGRAENDNKDDVGNNSDGDTVVDAVCICAAVSVVNRANNVFEAIGDVAAAPTVIVTGDDNNTVNLVDDEACVGVVPSAADFELGDRKNDNNLVDETGAGVVVVSPAADFVTGNREHDDNLFAVENWICHVYFYVAALLVIHEIG